MSAITEIQYRGTTINKVSIDYVAEYMEVFGMSEYDIFMELGDGESDFIYVSNGFLGGLRNLDGTDGNNGEWHHYFKKDNDGGFEAFKFNFNERFNDYGL